jgi:hypothetical protein
VSIKLSRLTCSKLLVDLIVVVVVQVDYETFMWKHRSHNERIKYLKTLLDPHCRLLDSATISDQLSSNKKSELQLPNENSNENGSSER